LRKNGKSSVNRDDFTDAISAATIVAIPPLLPDFYFDL
jgi:hypothetical protein